MEWPRPPGWWRRLGPRRAWLRADRLPSPPRHRNALLRKEWLATVPTLAVEMQSPECPKEERNSNAGRAFGEANLSSRLAWHRRRAAGWRMETRVSVLARVHHRSWRTGVG